MTWWNIRHICCHTFRATGITAYLEAGGTIEKAQAIAAHESPRTTKLYDRTNNELTLDENRAHCHLTGHVGHDRVNGRSPRASPMSP